MPRHPDFSRCATVTTDERRWVPSPQAGVGRMTLNRADGEDILVFSGTCPHDSGHGGSCGYLRHPPDHDSERRAGASGVTLHLKTGHLAGRST